MSQVQGDRQASVTMFSAGMTDRQIRAEFAAMGVEIEPTPWAIRVADDALARLARWPKNAAPIRIRGTSA